MKRSLYLLSLLFLLLSCNTDRAQTTRGLAQEMNDRKIKHVTEAQLSATMDEWGKAIVGSTQQVLTAELKKASEKQVIQSLCRLEGVAFVNSLEKRYGITIDLLRAEDVNTPQLDAKEREILEAYLYSARHGQEQLDNVQKLNDTLFVYNAPIPIDHLICRSCSDDITQPFVVWRVLFSKREVIRRIDPKKLILKRR